MPAVRLARGNVFSLIRSLRRRRGRTMLVLFLALAYILIILPFSFRRSQRAEVAAYDASISHLPPPRVFVAAMLANCAPLLTDYWIPSLFALIDKLGYRNVYISIVENGSVDDTRKTLLDMERILTQRQVPYTIRYEESFRDGRTFTDNGLLHRLLGQEGTGDNWMMTSSGWFPRRINYLSQLRNMVLEPLTTSSQAFDKILFLNDVIFSVRP
jgi:hypothetical protein